MADNNITTVKPFLTVSNGKKAVEFYISAFGAIEKRRFEMPNERLSSIIAIEEAEFYVGDEEPDYGNLSPDEGSNSAVRIILQTKNADKLFEQALKFGATEFAL